MRGPLKAGKSQMLPGTPRMHHAPLYFHLSVCRYWIKCGRFHSSGTLLSTADPCLSLELDKMRP